MVERLLTDQQRAALEARGRSVSLAAGAGCGKTFVLTERFLAHVDPTQVEQADLRKLAAITFTDAAAREMRDRIRRRCCERMQTAGDDREAGAWQRLMRSIDGARISTIHSFCTQLLRAHAVEAGLDPQFEVLDSAAAELLKLETVDDRLRSLLLGGDEDVLDLAAKRGLDRLRSETTALAGPGSTAAIERWRQATPDDLVARWRRYLTEEAAPAALHDVLSCDEARALRRLAQPELAVSAKLNDHLTKLATALEARPADPQQSADLLRELHELARVQGVCTAKDWKDAGYFPAFRDACKAFRERAKNNFLHTPFDEGSAREAARQGLALLRLADDVTAALEEAKAQRNQLEFDDLLARAHRLLSDPAQASLRRLLAETTELLMIDEFQDTNPLQAAIIQTYCGDDWRERGLFAVGDFKQSIYRFTGAEPRVSIDLRSALPPAGRLSLTRNFRSQPAITDFVNAVFHAAFEEYEPLTPARPQTTAVPAVEFLWTPGEGRLEAERDEGTAVKEPTAAAPHRGRRRAGAARDARSLEADWIARRLVQLLKSEEPIVVEPGADEPRPLRLGDVAILLRTLSDAQIYEEALRKYGLDYYLAGGHAFYSQQEVYDVLNLLRAVASEIDEVALAGALRSPLFSLADETLYWLVEKHSSLNAALGDGGAPPAELEEAEAAKVRRAAATMRRLRQEKDRLLVAELFLLAMDLTGYDAVLLTEFLGPRKAANLDKLIEQARALDRSSPGDLQGFITQLSEFVSRAPKEALAAAQSQGDVIQIMTIHYAKGLEFPVVVLPDLDRKRHAGATTPVLDVNLGPLVPLGGEEKHGTIGFDLYRYAEEAQDIEERRRLLYVACTRASDYLILSSSLDDPSKPQRDWLQLIDRQIDLSTGMLRQPLSAGYGEPRVRVVVERPLIDDENVVQPRGADLERLVIKARQLAAKSAGDVPRGCEPIPVDAVARRRFSFSQLTGVLTVQADEATDREGADEAVGVERPIGRREEGRALGLLVHAALEQIDLKNPQGVGELCAFLAPQFVGKSPERVASAAVTLVERFLRSPRGAELAVAQAVRREVEFLLPWPPGHSAGSERYIHGYIDCLYQDACGKWRLIDYKTNRVTAKNSADQVAAQYELQLLVYSLAVEQALGESLADVVLELLDTGDERSFNWNDAALRRGIERISAAMNDMLVPTR